MRILIFSTNGIKRDGITSWILQHMSRMDYATDEVDTLAFPNVDGAVLAELEGAGVTVHSLPSRKRHPFAYIRSLRELIRRREYDLVHINGNSATVVMDLLCCGSSAIRNRIVHAHNTTGQFVAAHRMLRPIMNALCTERLACGRAAGEWMFGRRRFDVMPNGREFEAYSFAPDVRSRVRSALGLPPECIAVGHVGNFSVQKNHRFLIDVFAGAIKENSKLRLFLIGDGPLRRQAEDQVSALGLEDDVVFLGRRSNVQEYLCAFDVAVLPSLHEGFPTVAVEWQISGLPSLLSTAVTDEVAVSDLVRFVPLGDSAAWSSEIARAQQVNRSTESSQAQKLLRSAGFEASDGAARLSSFYKAITQKVNSK